MDIAKKVSSQMDPIDLLMQTMARKKHSHAYLLYGAPGVGKRTLARRMASAVLCRQTNSPCGCCDVCRKIEQGIHPDLWIYDGREGKNAIHIDTVRHLRSDAVIRPNESDYKIYILPNVENLSPGGANAFLKLLEEPPAHVVFFLTAASKEAVLPTILSRCIPVFVPPMGEERLVRTLQERFPDTEDGILRAIAAQSDGIIGRTIARIEAKDSTAVSELVEGICNRSEYTLLRVLTESCTGQMQFLGVLEELLITVRSSLRHRFTPVDGANFPMADKLTLRQLEALTELIEQTRRDLQGNVHVGLAVAHFTAQVLEILLPSA